MGILLDRSLYQVRRTNVGLEVVGLTFVQSDCVYGSLLLHCIILIFVFYPRCYILYFVSWRIAPNLHL